MVHIAEIDESEIYHHGEAWWVTVRPSTQYRPRPGMRLRRDGVRILHMRADEHSASVRMPDRIGLSLLSRKIGHNDTMVCHLQKQNQADAT